MPRKATSPTAYTILPLRVPIPRACTVSVEVSVTNDTIEGGRCDADSKDSSERLECVSKPFMAVIASTFQPGANNPNVYAADNVLIGFTTHPIPHREVQNIKSVYRNFCR